MNISYTYLLLILIFLWLVLALLLGFSVRAWLIERREGMRISQLRLSVLSILFLIASGLVITSFFLSDSAVRPESAERTTAANNSSVANTDSGNSPLVGSAKSNEIESLNQQIKQAEKELADLDREREQVSRKVADLKKRLNPAFNTSNTASSSSGSRNEGDSSAQSAAASIPRENMILVFIALTAAFLLVGLIVLLIGGEIQTLFPADWSLNQDKSREKTSEKKLIQLSKAVWQKNYKEGLRIAKDIKEKRLNRFDRLDYLFLRAYCLVMSSTDKTDEPSEEEVRQMSSRAIVDLENVIDDAPNRAEALYLLGLAYGMSDKNAEALEMFDKAEKILKVGELPFAHNKSVCLLRLAENSLTKGDTEQAEKYFQQVTKLRILTNSVVDSRIKIGIIDLRKAINKQEWTVAKTAVTRLEQMTGLKDEQKLQREIMGVTFRALISLREGKADESLTQIEGFIAKYLPKNLPNLDEEVADETLGSPIEENELAFPHDIFRGCLFIQAVALSLIETRGKVMLSEQQVLKLKEPLLRALQFSPRHRDLLGALGGLVYWFNKDRRQKAIEWLEAAATMGVSGTVVKQILEYDRQIEVERRNALDWFRSVSVRFLRDPSISSEVRNALREELGRFQEFETLIINLDEKPDFEPQTPTLEVIKERSKYLLKLVDEFSKRGKGEQKVRLQKISDEYSVHLRTLENTTESISSLERNVFEELGDILEI